MVSYVLLFYVFILSYVIVYLFTLVCIRSQVIVISGLYGIPLEEVVRQMYVAVMDFIHSATHLQDVVLIDRNQTAITLLLDVFNQEMGKYNHIQPADNTLHLPRSVLSGVGRDADGRKRISSGEQDTG